MTKLICCLRDRKAELFQQPFFVPTVGVATRNLQDEVRRSAADNPLSTHPEDFDLFELGSYDDESGLVEGLLEARLVYNCASLVEK